MGEMGTYVLGQKYAAKWAALGVMSGTLADVQYSIGMLNVRRMGIKTDHVEIEAGTHMSMIAPTVPRIFEFFAAQTK